MIDFLSLRPESSSCFLSPFIAARSREYPSTGINAARFVSPRDFSFFFFFITFIILFFFKEGSFSFGEFHFSLPTIDLIRVQSHEIQFLPS